jgi:hypothetical protein
MNAEISLTVLRGKLAICRFETGTDLPDWALTGKSFHSITHTPDEVSIVLPQKNINLQEISCERDWRALRVDGKLDFNLCGVLLSILDVLNDLSVSVFVVSTYDTDYILVKEHELTRTIHALKKKFTVSEELN